MSKERQMFEDLVEIFEEEYEKRRLITPQNTAEKMTAKGYRKQSEGEWKLVQDKGAYGDNYFICSVCEGKSHSNKFNYCPNCGAKMKGGGE